jgi:hypothetical protein
LSRHLVVLQRCSTVRKRWIELNGIVYELADPGLHQRTRAFTIELGDLPPISAGRRGVCPDSFRTAASRRSVPPKRNNNAPLSAISFSRA